MLQGRCNDISTLQRSKVPPPWRSTLPPTQPTPTETTHQPVPALHPAIRAAEARAWSRVRSALLSAVGLSVCAGLVLAGAAAEVWLRPRAVPQPERRLKDQQLASLAPAQVDAILARLGPGIPEETRARLSETLVTEGARNGYDPLFLLALIGVESRYKLGAESGRGARGLVQLKPSTFAWISAREPDAGGEDLESGDDPVVDVRLAVRYFRWLEHRFQSRTSALIAYNAGPRNAARALKGGDVPDRWKSYPELVRREYERVLRIAAGGKDVRGDLLLARQP